MFGLPTRRQALAHSITPALLSISGWLPAAAGFTLFDHDGEIGFARQVLALLAATTVSIGAQWITAFRVAAPDHIYFPETGPVLLVLWWFRPLLLATSTGTFLAATIATAQPASDPLRGLVMPVMVLAGVAWAARRGLVERN